MTNGGGFETAELFVTVGRLTLAICAICEPVAATICGHGLRGMLAEFAYPFRFSEDAWAQIASIHICARAVSFSAAGWSSAQTTSLEVVGEHCSFPVQVWYRT